MTWEWLAHLLPLVTLVTAVVVVTWLIRWRKFPGLGALIHAPAVYFGLFARDADAVVKGHADKIYARTRNRIRATVDAAGSPMDSAILLVVLGSAWVVITWIVVQRTAAITLRPLQSAAQSGAVRLTNLDRLEAYTKALAIVLLTAFGGLLLSELVGLTRHIGYLHAPAHTENGASMRGRRLGAFALAVLVVFGAAISQTSIARQSIAHERGVVDADIYLRQQETVVPLPSEPTQADVDMFNQQIAAFDATYAEPRRAELAAIDGPLGSGNVVPFVLTTLDALLAWAFVGLLIVLGCVASAIGVSVLRVATLVMRAVTALGLTASGAALQIFNVPPLELPKPPTESTNGDRPEGDERAAAHTRGQRSRPVPEPEPDAKPSAAGPTPPTEDSVQREQAERDGSDVDIRFEEVVAVRAESDS